MEEEVYRICANTDGRNFNEPREVGGPLRLSAISQNLSQ